MRGWIADNGNYSAPIEIGAVMRALAVGEVIESRVTPDIGQATSSRAGSAGKITPTPLPLRRRAERGEPDLPRSLALGVLGINGVTALIGLDPIGEPQRRRYRAGFDGGRRGRLGCRADREADGMPGRRRSRAARRRSRCAASRFGYDAAIDYRTQDVAAALG